MDELIKQLLSRYDSAEQYLVNKREAWDEYEGIFLNKVEDKVSQDTNNVLSDPILSTMAIERSNRVMAQLPTGKVKSMSRNDDGVQKLMNMTLEKYVLPNANAQFDFLTKNRMVDLYSNIYGNFFVFCDWDVKKNSYIGPDMWLLNIRDVFPQVGAISLEDSDYIIVRTWKPLSYFEGLEDDDDYQNIPDVVKKLKMMSGDKTQKSAYEKSKRDYDYPEPISTNGDGQFAVLSMYERDRWVDYVPGAQMVIRDIDNPQDNGELPVVCKYSIPLLDDPMGMGDFERGKSMQYGLNSLWNLYVNAMRISIFPPTLINKDAIAAASTMKMGPAEKWLIRGNPSAAVAPMNISPAGLQTFQATRSTIVGSLLNQFGTTFTSSSTETSEELGKTPQALKLQAARENARDSADRFYMEQFLTKVIKRFVNLLAKKQPKALYIRLFPEELNELLTQYPELEEYYNEKKGALKINKGKFTGCFFDYEIVSGSTFQADQADQQENLRAIFALITQNLAPNQQGEISSPIIDRLKFEGRETSVSELLTRIVANGGVQDWDKIFPDLTNGDPEAYKASQIRQQHDQMFQQALMQSGIPPEAINSIPATPDGGMNGQVPATGY